MSGLIVHEWIARHGGSENVLEAMSELFPNADIFCLWNDDPERFLNRTVEESWLARTPLRHSKLASLPVMPATWASVDIHDRDFVLVSSHLFAHHVGVKRGPEGPQRYVYVHTPARYVWVPHLDSRGRSIAARAVSPFLRWFDARKADSGSLYAANSRFIRERINACWDVDATVIYPPVDVANIRANAEWSDNIESAERRIFDALPEKFILGASRFVPYKRLDIVIRAGEAAGLPVVLAGAGPERGHLEDIASAARVPVTFISYPSNSLLYALYQRAAVFVFPPVEDFGIMPVEAMSLGTPVVVYAEGGARESVERVFGGIVIEDFGPDVLAEGVSRSLDIDMTDVPQRVESEFGKLAFKRNIACWMTEVVGAKYPLSLS